MTITNEQLVQIAIAFLTLKWGSVTPCSGKTWIECLTVEGDHRALWFNDASGSTHIHWL